MDRESFCPACGWRLPPSARFCPGCGRSLTSPSEPTGEASSAEGGQGLDGTQLLSAREVSPAAASPEGQETSDARPRVGSGEETNSGDEVRPVTILFSDIVGSTALGERLRPDEVKALIGECVSRMSRVVEDFGGVVQAYMGDGICALFGVPTSRGDDPERAASAALRMIAMAQLYAKDIEAAWGISGFNIRVGLNTGAVAVGLVGAGAPSWAAMGDATNVAARLQAHAAPGTILVGASLARRLDESFELARIGEIMVRGRAEPVESWRLVKTRSRREASRPTPLIGRVHEASMLAAAADAIRAGRGEVLLLEGAAGLGKSRLVLELQRLCGDEVQWLKGHCVSYDHYTPYRPFIEMLRQWLEVQDGDPAISVRTKLLARLGGVFPSESSPVLPLLARMLGAEGSRERADPLTSLHRGQGTRDAFLQWLEHLSRHSPVVVTVEDLHWSDKASNELLEDVLEATERAPLLAAITLEMEPGSSVWELWSRVLSRYAHRVREIKLHPVVPEDARGIVRATSPVALRSEVEDQIVERAEGNPLFLEELTRVVAQGGGQTTRRSWTLTNGARDLPDNIESLLLARLDRLPARARRLAQTASVIGRSFTHRLLRAAYDGSDVDADLAVLVRNSIVRESHRYPELQYTFAHGLLQEAALSTLTPATARLLYTRVAAAFEDLVASRLEDNLQTLAYYYYRSDDAAKALHYLRLAAARAEAVDPTFDARRLWQRAMKMARRLRDEEAYEAIRARVEARA